MIPKITVIVLCCSLTFISGCRCEFNIISEQNFKEKTLPDSGSEKFLNDAALQEQNADIIFDAFTKETAKPDSNFCLKPCQQCGQYYCNKNSNIISGCSRVNCFRLNDSCLLNEQCETGFCQNKACKPCTTDQDCGFGICNLNGICVLDEQKNFACIGRCNSCGFLYCPAGTQCKQPEHCRCSHDNCYDWQWPCNNHTDCLSLLCKNKACASCQLNADCSTGQYCHLGQYCQY